MSRAVLFLVFSVGILALALSVVLVLALLPYLHLIGIALMVILAITALGALAYGGHALLLGMQARYLDQELKRIQVEAARHELDYVRPTQHGHVTAIRSEDGSYRYTPLLLDPTTSRKALPAPAEPPETAEQELVIPQAPPFRAMCHLLAERRLVLCYTAAGPAYGTVEDLLSMAIVGKPGRGKTTALLYYVAILLGVGAEVHVWDPHGSMRELSGCHPKLSYLDTLDELPRSIVSLQHELEERSLLFKQHRQVRYPLLLLVDELPVIGDYEKLLRRRGVSEEQTPTHLIKRMVLEARKWRCFFIASGQSTDAQILPTRVTENLSSRIIFFSSDRRARMAGLEQEAVKRFLPVIRRAGPGVMIFDCSSWDEPVLGAVPETTVEDLHDFFFGGLGRRSTAPSPVNSAQTPAAPEDVHSAFTVPLELMHDVHPPALASSDTVIFRRERLSAAVGVNAVKWPLEDGERSVPEEDETAQEDVNAPLNAGEDVPAEEVARILTAALRMQEHDGEVVRTRLLKELGENRKYWPILKVVLDRYGL